MPRLNRKSRHRRELTFAETFMLRSGYARDGRAVRKVTDEELADYWRVPAIREQVMRLDREHSSQSWPHRPFAFWRLELGESPPEALEPSWAEPSRLLELGELDEGERARLAGLIHRELRIRRARAGMDPPEWIPELERLAERLAVEDADDDD